MIIFEVNRRIITIDIVIIIITIHNIFYRVTIFLNFYNEKITKMVEEYVYNLGNSAEFGAKYIIDVIQNKIEERKKEGKK